VKTYPKKPTNIPSSQVSTNVVWFFHFKRNCNPDFDIVKLFFGGLIGVRVWANLFQIFNPFNSSFSTFFQIQEPSHPIQNQM
jgi:hypothetical protein